MSRKNLPVITTTLKAIVGGGQALGTMPDGRKVFVWGGLPDEKVIAQVTKSKSSHAEGVVTEVLSASPDRIEPLDPDSYLSTSPWQIMTFDAEQRHKATLIDDAFKLHKISLPNTIDVFSDGQSTHYRNKVEFSWFGDDSSGQETLHLAFFRRGSQGKIIVNDSALLPPKIITLAKSIRDWLQANHVTARQLKTLLIRSDQSGNCTWQLYVKDEKINNLESIVNADLNAQGGEIIYSNPQSPASVITKRLASTGSTTLTDTVLGVPFRYATEGFFQINLPVYEQALLDMKQSIPKDREVVDLYSGVGSIGLTIGGDNVTLVEVNEHAVREMKQNIQQLGLKATPILAASEDALDHITSDKTVIVDPPRAGLHDNVIERILEQLPDRLVYLSCNPVTQARDTAKLTQKYKITRHRGYNFFPRTPHIEHLVVLDKK